MSEEDKSIIKNLVADLCMSVGFNIAHDYDGIEDTSDIILYLKALNKLLKHKKIKE